MTELTQVAATGGAQKDGYDELRDEVMANGNILAVQMARLREAAGYGRLGKWVVQDIDDKLRSRGLGHTPLADNNQWATVYVYVMGSEVERIVNAALNPSESGADTIRSATNEDATEVLRRIRSLLEGV